MGELVRLRPARDADFDLVAHWLRQSDVGRWWGSAASGAAKIRLARETPGAITRMMDFGGATVGYAQAIEAGVLGGARPASVPPGAWDCDAFVGSPEHRGQGLGGEALDLLAREVFSTTLAIACVALISVRREAAARACERIGFRWSEVWPDPLLGPSWVMVRLRQQA